MADPDQKSEQVRWLEKKLQYRLWPCLTDDVLGWENRKCYTLDADGNITGLNLADCEISDWSFLSELSELTSLDLSYNSISDLSILKKLCGLTRLSVQGNKISDSKFLDELDDLKSLDVSNNWIPEFASLSHLSGLTELKLSCNERPDWSFLSSMENLTGLKISGVSWVGFWISDATFLSELCGLTNLDLSLSSITDWTFLRELDGLTSLNLSSSSISDATFLSELSGLKNLVLCNNSISDLTFLSDLCDLTNLDLTDNPISDATVLSSLNKLASVSLSGDTWKRYTISEWSFLNELRGLTCLCLSRYPNFDWERLSELCGLTSLSLSHNSISDPTFLSKLSELTSLDLSDNSITDWHFLRELRGLNNLNLCNNSISDNELLTELLNRGELRTLNLKGNTIRELPSSLSKLHLRSQFEYRHTLFDSLPQSINLHGNPLEFPPIEILEKGHPAVVSWFNEFRAESAASDNDERPLHEVKVILIGDGRAGKTSIRKRLMGELVDRNEQQTHGIELQNWDVDVRDWQADAGEAQVRVHFWDFGGQVINHSTHQFFLSRRSLYIVVLDNRKDEDAEYWLKMIETFGGDSPVLVVMNKIDEHPGFEVNRSFLADKYPGVQPDRFFRLSCWNDELGDGITALKKSLLRELADVDMVRTPWISRWRNVKQQLEERNEDYIEYSEFEQTCDDCGVTDENAQKTLVGYLSDLGIALHFAEFGMQNLQVLNPRWATQAVYRIINARQLADGKGVLPLATLQDILKQTEPTHFDYPAACHQYVINLMKKFEVCYELNPQSHPQTILVPDLLDVAEPEFDFPTEDLLRFRYEYDFLPRSILPRFIVRWHADIDDELRWRTGVVVKDEDLDARAVVWSDIRDRKIMIDVAGNDRREYFRRIRTEFRKIHGTFQKLDVTEKVPLPDKPDHDVDYLDLLFHEEKRRATILVGGLRREYNVQRLLDGIETPEDRLHDQFARHPNQAVRPDQIFAGIASEFDVFLSHNSKDKDDVRTLNSELKDRGVRTWLDEEHLQFGDSISDELQRILDNCGSALVCVGKHGLGPWHDEEQKVLTTRRVDARRSREKFRIIPVYLPTAPPDAEMPAFLRDQLAVDLRGGMSDEILDKLKTAVMLKH